MFERAHIVSPTGKPQLPDPDELTARWRLPLLVIGDFNDSPFDISVADAMHATRDRGAVTPTAAQPPVADRPLSCLLPAALQPVMAVADERGRRPRRNRHLGTGVVSPRPAPAEPWDGGRRRHRLRRGSLRTFSAGAGSLLLPGATTVLVAAPAAARRSTSTRQASRGLRPPAARVRARSPAS